MAKRITREEEIVTVKKIMLVLGVEFDLNGCLEVILLLVYGNGDGRS